MEWSEEGIVVGVRRHGEVDAILEVLTAGHGRHLGLVKGGRSRRSARSFRPETRFRSPGGRGSTSTSAISAPRRWRSEVRR